MPQTNDLQQPKLFTLGQKSIVIIGLGFICFVIGPYLNFWSNQLPKSYWYGLLWLLYFAIGIQVAYFNKLNLKYTFLTNQEYETIKKILLQRYKEQKK